MCEALGEKESSHQKKGFVVQENIESPKKEPKPAQLATGNECTTRKQHTKESTRRECGLL